MMDYADSITAERVKRVINTRHAELVSASRGEEIPKQVRNDSGEVRNDSEQAESFSFYELGEPLLINNLLNEKVDTQTIREYIWFTETGKKMPHGFDFANAKSEDNKNGKSLDFPNPCDNPENQYFLGVNYGTAYWFYYEKNLATTLDIQFLQTVKNKYEQYVIYADICLIPQELLQRNNIIFKKIPRDIKKF